ncbi:hypothetical protein KVG88_00575 [Pseudomonas sp. SWRI74]|uniref:Uncharacterized protein n=1 Tax=Pseudomonas azerbaijanoccidentalis TaxID=2842347 RepID=A0ABS6QHY2_9PSED|nr:hypothetical protein [Pseudomonas azerbaijanoccidentalis]MBV4518543.1 hypothetical protein [Pseudomonas azerbaijanoccidentalis]
MRVWGADGALQLDENSFTMRVVLSTLVTFPNNNKANQDFSVPGSDASNSVAIVIPVGPYDEGSARQFETEMLSGVARVYNHTRTFEASLSTSGTMRLMVIRFA